MSSPSFQSLSRDSGHLNLAAMIERALAHLAFQSLSRDSGHLNEVQSRAFLAQHGFRFNPSVGIRGI